MNIEIFRYNGRRLNGSSHPNYENRLFTTVPRLRASPRHGGARRFFAFFSHLNRRTGSPVGGGGVHRNGKR